MKKLKLFCIPHAGASATCYYKWLRYLDESMIELYPLELKGRGARSNEPFYADFEDMVNDLYEDVKNIISTDDKYMLYGHSMGSYAAFRLETMLEKNLGVCADCVFVSGREAPSVWGDKKKYISHLNTDVFLNEIKSYGGLDEKFFDDEDVLNYILPIIRNDFRIIETLDASDKGKLIQSPIMVLNGKNDVCEPNNVDLWKMHSSADCTIKYFTGGHFYIDDHLEEIVSFMNEVGRKTLVAQ